MENAQTPDEGNKTAKKAVTPPASGARKPPTKKPAGGTTAATRSTKPRSVSKPTAAKPTAAKPAVRKPAVSKPAAAKPAAASPIAPKLAVPEIVVPAEGEAAIAAPDASQPAEKPDAVLAGLARLRLLASQFAAPASAVDSAPVELGMSAPAKPTLPEPTAPEPTAPEPTLPEPTAPPALTHALVATSDDVVLEVRGLSKGFGDTVAVNDIDLTVRAGVFYGIVGPNGAGKTTTLSMITGLLRPDSGTASVNGVKVWDSPAIAKRSMGVLPDRLRIFDRLTGSQLLYYSGVLRGLGAAEVRKRSADLATAFGLEDVMGRLVSDYSSGMLKKVALAAAMIHSPRLLVLDEPFESVDPVSATTVIRILKQYVSAGGTVVLSSHRMELVQRVCSHVAVIVEGTLLADGTIDEVRNGMSLEDRFVQLTGTNSVGGGLEWLSSFSD
ncbi:ABC-2 type transport system ATP-binding protein [Rhodoglobus vestalii]|uniref:ABC-2 type transport system ATP-binding protein n=1 Tax=Rhodoglobus vestalii TaxID=193384 RepID=A0A8H2K5M3_9MICO|nr:ABC-2 type transport system ATP-binding protein [Rhodoglobus vestalii]